MVELELADELALVVSLTLSVNESAITSGGKYRKKYFLKNY